MRFSPGAPADSKPARGAWLAAARLVLGAAPIGSPGQLALASLISQTLFLYFPPQSPAAGGNPIPKGLDLRTT